MRTECFETPHEHRLRFRLQKTILSNPAISYLLLNDPLGYFCCGSSVLHVGYVRFVSNNVVTCIIAAHHASCLVLFCNLKQKIGKIVVTVVSV